MQLHTRLNGITGGSFPVLSVSTHVICNRHIVPNVNDSRTSERYPKEDKRSSSFSHSLLNRYALISIIGAWQGSNCTTGWWQVDTRRNRGAEPNVLREPWNLLSEVHGGVKCAQCSGVLCTMYDVYYLMTTYPRTPASATAFAVSIKRRRIAFLAILLDVSECPLYHMNKKQFPLTVA